MPTTIDSYNQVPYKHSKFRVISKNIYRIFTSPQTSQVQYKQQLQWDPYRHLEHPNVQHAAAHFYVWEGVAAHGDDNLNL